MGILKGNTGILGSIIGGLFDFGSQIAANQAAKKQQQREQKFNADQAQMNREYQTSEREASQQWNLEQWERENEYNSPANQMARMAAAGINPAAAAQAVAGGSSGSVQQSSVAGSSNPQSGAVASAPSYSGSMAQLLGNSANSALNSALTIAETTGAHIHNKNLQKQYDASIENLKSNTAKNFQDVEVGKQQADFLGEQANRLKLLTPVEVEQCRQQTNLIMAEILNTEANTELVEAETAVAESQVAMNEAQTAATYQSIKESKARIANLDANTSLAIAEAAKVYAEKNNVEADTVIKNFEASVKQLEAQCAQQGISFNANEVAAGACYEMINGTGTAKDFYEPVTTYEKGIIKYEHKQKRRDAWNQAGADVASNIASKAAGKALKFLLKK